MVTGVRVEFTGEEVRRAINERIEDMKARSEHWKNEAERPLESQTIDNPVLPTHMCLNEHRRSLWRADVLSVVRDRIKPPEVYLLSTRDMKALGLLPPKPQLIGPYDLEDETVDGFSVERMDTDGGLEVCCIRKLEADDGVVG